MAPTFPTARPTFALPEGVAARLTHPHRLQVQQAREDETRTRGGVTDFEAADVAPPTRADVRTAERTLQAAAGQEVKGGSMSDVPLIKASTAAELAGPLALAAMRVLERGINDPNPHVAFEAARVAATVAPKVVDLTGKEAGEVDPAAKRAALLAALATPAFCELLVTVVASSEAPARKALEAAGWRAPGGED